MICLSYLLCLAATLRLSAHAFPSTTGSCAAGSEAIVSDPHTTATRIITGSLAIGGYSVKLGATTLSPTSTSTFTVGVGTTLTITGTKPFTGFFVRLGEVDGVQTDTALSGTGDVKIPRVCTTAGVGGVCQTSSSRKTSVTASLRLDSAAASMPLDVTIVVSGNNDVSEYYYSQFVLSATPANTPLTMNPIVTPTMSPAVTPTMSPVLTPTMKPVMTPTVKPVMTPTLKPILTPTRKPTRAITNKPVRKPTLKPTVMTPDLDDSFDDRD